MPTLILIRKEFEALIHASVAKAIRPLAEQNINLKISEDEILHAKNLIPEGNDKESMENVVLAHLNCGRELQFINDNIGSHLSFSFDDAWNRIEASEDIDVLTSVLETLSPTETPCSTDAERIICVMLGI